ncbi:MAG: NAD-dependent epimerase/dehydratase family protein [Oscillospiraceae bacterium]|nr:NAD-dependent epimerase/dehydratase family protein [Oscillospiraceae bacterium]
MFQNYLVTGATGFLGRAVTQALLREGKRVRALVLEGDPLEKALPESVEVVRGDVCTMSALAPLFSGAGGETCVIHCAGIVSVASRPDARMWTVNVVGTRNVLRHCESAGVRRMIYVSSVHAIPGSPEGASVMDPGTCSLPAVRGHYAESKAEATYLVTQAARRGLDAVVVFPSCVVGPGDIGKGSFTSMLISYLSGRLPFAVRGGYDFTDVRDVAAGIVACAERGRVGKGYVLSGRYASIGELLALADAAAGTGRRPLLLPLWLAKAAAPFYERRCLKAGKPAFFTPYAMSVLGSRCRYGSEDAARDFGYSSRPLSSTVRDTVTWLKQNMGL